jgi:hypothetical protein
MIGPRADRSVRRRTSARVRRTARGSLKDKAYRSSLRYGSARCSCNCLGSLARWDVSALLGLRFGLVVGLSSLGVQ